MFKKVILFGAIGVLLLPGAAAAELASTRCEAVDHDPLGVWQKSRSFKEVKRAGAQVIFTPEEDNFFVIWTPPGFRSGRIMVAVHGTGGSPYEEIKDEIALAREFDYMVVAVNWYKPRTGYFKADRLYRAIQQALSYVRDERGVSLSAVAYIGFSRGGAISYETAYLDVRSERIFDLFIAHSGGIPEDFRVEAKNPGSKPDTFFKDLAVGALGPEPLKGAAFFLYSGDRDESWGITMSRQMAYAEKLIEANGGEVVERVRREDLGHAGLRKDRSINDKAVRHFIERTS